MWYRVLNLPILETGDADYAPIIVYVMDWDLTDEDDLMGMCVINVDEALFDINKRQKPKWRQLSMGT
jgi:hypothetical protein